MFVAYLQTFERMGLKAIPMRADTGPIGGDLSHEFHILADTGESELFFDSDVVKLDEASIDPDIDLRCRTISPRWYAATDEKHDKAEFEPRVPEAAAPPGARHRGRPDLLFRHQIFEADERRRRRARRRAGDGRDGLLRHRRLAPRRRDHRGEPRRCQGIIWPESVAPFKVGLINLRAADAKCAAACDDLYGKLRAAGIEVLYDDRDESAGAKFAAMDLIGLPWQLVIGPRGARQQCRRAEGPARAASAGRSRRDAALAIAGRPVMIFGAFERMVAFRYLRARRQEGFISVIAIFSLLGIALGRGHARSSSCR